MRLAKITKALFVIGLLSIVAALFLRYILPTTAQSGGTNSLSITLEVAGVLIIAVAFLSRRAVIFNTKRKNWPLVIGTLASIHETGKQTRLAKEAEITVDFFTADGGRFTGAQKLLIMKSSFQNYQQGMMLPVRYDPANPQNIIFDMLVGKKTMEDAYDQLLLAAHLVSQETVDITKNGVKASGVILSMEPTGNTVEGSAEFRIKLSVTKAGGQTYEVTTLKHPNQIYLNYMKAGANVAVYYLPGDEQKVALAIPNTVTFGIGVRQWQD